MSAACPRKARCCRASLEALFGLLAVVEQPETAQLLVRGDRNHQLKLLKATRRRCESLGADAQKQVDLVFREVKEALERDPSSEMTTRSLAERGGLVAFYDSAYTVLSLPVHSNLRDLERQLGLDQEGHPSSIRWGLNIDGLDESLMLLADILIRATTAMCGFFNLGHQGDLEEIRSRYAPLAARMLEGMPNNGVEQTPKERRGFTRHSGFPTTLAAVPLCGQWRRSS